MRSLITVIIVVGVIWLVWYALTSGLLSDVIDPYTPPH